MSFNTNYHVDYMRNVGQWRKNKDASRNRVHAAKERYLPANLLPPQALSSDENRQLQAYIKHKYDTQIWPMSVFFDFTRPTLAARIGMIMMKRPTIQFSDKLNTETPLDYLLHNADGAGNGLINVARLVLEATDETGGGVILKKMPDGKMTTQSLRDGSVAPRLYVYDRENVLDWESKYLNSRKELTYIKLREFETYSDGTDSEEIEKHIEFFLADGVVTFKIARDQSFDGYPSEESGVLIEAGKQATRIPVRWFGANDNEETPDPAPISPIANLNVLHYVMYSRHIQQCYDAGQGQYHIDLGTLQDLMAVDENNKPISPIAKLNPGGVKLNSISPIVTANGGSVNLLQLSTDSLLALEPEKIEERALKIGAQMISDNQADTTATASRIAFGAATASLSTVAENATVAIQQSIRDIAVSIGYNPELVKFELNKKFITDSLTAQDRTSFMQMVMQGTYPLKALHRVLQRAGEIPDEMDFDEFKAAIEEDEGFFNLRGVGSVVNNNATN